MASMSHEIDLLQIEYDRFSTADLGFTDRDGEIEISRSAEVETLRESRIRSIFESWAPDSYEVRNHFFSLMTPRKRPHSSNAAANTENLAMARSVTRRLPDTVEDGVVQ